MRIGQCRRDLSADDPRQHAPRPVPSGMFHVKHRSRCGSALGRPRPQQWAAGSPAHSTAAAVTGAQRALPNSGRQFAARAGPPGLPLDLQSDTQSDPRGLPHHLDFALRPPNLRAVRQAPPGPFAPRLRTGLTLATRGQPHPSSLALRPPEPRAVRPSTPLAPGLRTGHPVGTRAVSLIALGLALRPPNLGAVRPGPRLAPRWPPNGTPSAAIPGSLVALGLARHRQRASAGSERAEDRLASARRQLSRDLPLAPPPEGPPTRAPRHERAPAPTTSHRARDVPRETLTPAPRGSTTALHPPAWSPPRTSPCPPGRAPRRLHPS